MNGRVEFRNVTLMRKDNKLHIYGITHKKDGGDSSMIDCHIIDEDGVANGVAFIDADGDIEILDILVLHMKKEVDHEV